MKKISSKSTFIYKYVIPLLTFWMAINFFMWVYSESNGDKQIYAFLIIPGLMLIVIFIIFKKTAFNLVDEVFYNEEYFLFKNFNKSITIFFSDIETIKYQMWTRPKRVIIILNINSEFGDKIYFMPPLNKNPFRKNKEIVRLINKIQNRIVLDDYI